MKIEQFREPISSGYISRMHIETNDDLGLKIDVKVSDCAARLCHHAPLPGFVEIKVSEQKGDDSVLGFSCKSWGQDQYVGENLRVVNGSLEVQPFQTGRVFLEKRFTNKYGKPEWRPILGIDKGVALDGLYLYDKVDNRVTRVATMTAEEATEGKLTVRKGYEKYVYTKEPFGGKMIRLADRIFEGKGDTPAKKFEKTQDMIMAFASLYYCFVLPISSLCVEGICSDRPVMKGMGVAGIGIASLPIVAAYLYSRKKAKQFKAEDVAWEGWKREKGLKAFS